MKITRAILENYKCHKYSEIDFTKFHVLIGSNNSGKTSFMEAFQIIKNHLWIAVPDMQNKIFGSITDDEVKLVSFAAEIELTDHERVEHIILRWLVVRAHGARLLRLTGAASGFGGLLAG